MTTKTEKFTEQYLRKDLPDIKPGDTVKIHQKVKFGDQERTQMFEGKVLARKHGKGLPATITVRREISGIGVEKIFPLHSPTIEKIEIIKRGKVRRAKIYYLRTAKGRKARLKRVEIKGRTKTEEKKEEEKPKEEKPEKEKNKEEKETKKETKEEK
jgi:large subunit ribosomal protein L19